MKEERPVFVVGHKNPDTDSVCGAIALAYLKNIKKQKEYIPYILGEIFVIFITSSLLYPNFCISFIF